MDEVASHHMRGLPHFSQEIIRCSAKAGTSFPTFFFLDMWWAHN